MLETAAHDGRLARGERTRTAVLDAAVSLATEAGLDGLSLAQLAQRLGVSKSGLFAHWRSKEELQLATIDRARDQWAERVVAPAMRAPRGVGRIYALHEARMGFYEKAVLPGGCFFANTEFEYSVRPGVVRDRLVEVFREWMCLLEQLVGDAVAVGELPAGTDVPQLAFEIEALGLVAVVQSRLLTPTSVYAYARRAVRDRLRVLCRDPSLLPEVEA